MSVQVLGEGAEGIVCKANYHQNGEVKIVAWKRLKPKVFQSESWKKLKKEFHNQNLLNHENIVKVYGWTKQIIKGKIFYGIVMENMDRGDLEGKIPIYLILNYVFQICFFVNILVKLLDNPDERQIIKWALDIAQALKYMHSLEEFKMIHRDIKPDNLILNEKNVLKLCDFGFSRELTSIPYTSCGTPIYMAPEIFIRNQGYSEKCDNHSWGLTFWRCLTKEKPFEGVSNQNLRSKKIDPETKFSNIPMRSRFSSEMNDIIQDCLKNDPVERPTMEEVVERLENLLKLKLDFAFFLNSPFLFFYELFNVF